MWETDKWVLEWVIGHAIAHLHGLGIRAGVHRTQAHHLNPESPSRRLQDKGNHNSVSASRCALSPQLQPHLSVISLRIL